MDYQAARLEERCGVGNVIKDFKSASKVPLRKRAAFQEAIARLMALPAATKKVLLVTRLDRLSRRIEDIQYMRELMGRGIEFDSLDSGGVSGGAMGNFSLTMRLAMAEYEAGLISEKIAGRYQDRRKAGQPMNNAPFGYKLHKKVLAVGVSMQLMPHPVQAEQAKEIYAAVIKHKGVLSQVLRECQFNKMPRTSRGLRMWLLNPVNLGHLNYNTGEQRLKAHDALIDQATFDQAALWLKDRYASKPRQQRSKPLHPLAGLVRCPCCGYTASLSTRVYTCSGSKVGRYRREAGEQTIKHTFECRRRRSGDCTGAIGKALGKDSIQQLHEAVLENLFAKREALAQGRVADPESVVDQDERKLQNKIEQLKADPDAALFKTAIQQLEEQLEQKQLKRRGMADRQGLKQSELKALNLSRAAWEQLTSDEQNLILRQFVLQVVPATEKSPMTIELLV